MIAVINGEVKAVVRQMRGVVWCPFCDRSRSLKDGYFCDGCRAEFSAVVETPVEAVVEPVVEASDEAETAPRRRSKAE